VSWHRPALLRPRRQRLGEHLLDDGASVGTVHPHDRMASVALVCLPSNKVSAFPWGRPVASCQLQTTVPETKDIKGLLNCNPHRTS
jgi:hypothetical protein